MKTITKKNVLKLAAAALVFLFAANVVNAQFPANAGEYASADEESTTKVTVGKPMPFWVYPDAVYNPDWTVPIASGIPAYVTVASITDDVISSFAWTTAGDPTRTNENENYVELQWNTLGTHVIAVVESPVGGLACDGDGQDLSVVVIDEPYVKFGFSVSTQLGLDSVMFAACGGHEDLQTAIAIAFENDDEENPYHINLGYIVYDVPFDGATGDLDWDNRSSVVPIGLEVYGQDGTNAPSEANPIIRDNTESELIPERTYTGIVGFARVYQFELVGWNAKISRKSDYISLRDGGLDPDVYENYVYHNDSGEGDVLLARIVVLPAPVTGPIYHIPDSFGL